jgi:hypothetical protein
MFKNIDYSVTMKGGGSREPLPFTSVDPLFYLSSFQPLLARRPLPQGSGLFVFCGSTIMHKRFPASSCILVQESS